MERLNLIRYPPHTAEKLYWARILLVKQVNIKRWRQLVQVAMFAALAGFVVQVCFTLLPYSLFASSYFLVGLGKEIMLYCIQLNMYTHCLL